MSQICKLFYFYIKYLIVWSHIGAEKNTNAAFALPTTVRISSTE